MTTAFQRDDFDVQAGPYSTIIALFKPIGMRIEFDFLGKRDGWIALREVRTASPDLGGYDKSEIVDEATRRAMAQAQYLFARA
jgi:hypothetical protein